MFALYFTALVCWVSVSRSAPLSCENQIQPVDKLDFRDLKGSWVLVSVTTSNPAHLERQKQRDSTIVVFANHSDPSQASFQRIYSFADNCHYMQANITLGGSGFYFPQHNVTVTLLQTSCADCLLMSYRETDRPNRLYLFSRRREVEPSELEEFKTKAECLSMAAPAVMDPTKELCPEQISAAPNDTTTEGQKA